MYKCTYKLTNPRLYDESTEVCEGGGVWISLLLLLLLLLVLLLWLLILYPSDPPLVSTENRWCWWLLTVWWVSIEWSWFIWFCIWWWRGWWWWGFVGWWWWGMWCGWWWGWCWWWCRFDGWWCPFAKEFPMVRVVLVPTPIPPAAANEEGNDCNGRGRMWAGEREQSVGYSVTETLIYQKRCLMLLLDDH